MSAGTKADGGKLQWHLFPFDAVEWPVPTTRSEELATILRSWWMGRLQCSLCEALPHVLGPEDYEGAVRVLEFGAAKYAPRNWEQGIAYSRLFSAAMRHLNAEALVFGEAKVCGWERVSGEARVFGEALVYSEAHVYAEGNDRETALPHFHHAVCCALFLSAYEARKMGEQWDDRP